jgi:hypothetical protein
MKQCQEAIMHLPRAVFAKWKNGAGWSCAFRFATGSFHSSRQSANFLDGILHGFVILHGFIFDEPTGTSARLLFFPTH